MTSMNAIKIANGQRARAQWWPSGEVSDDAQRLFHVEQFTISQLCCCQDWLLLGFFPMTDSSASNRRFVVLISGQGSNMQQIVEQARAGCWPASFVRVISNKADSEGLAWAKANGLPTAVLPHADFASRQAFDEALACLIEQDQPDYVLLAGFMRILTPEFVARFKNRLINIHPSLLPAFTGLKTHERALAAGVGWHGCTVHFVTETLDHGPIIAQAALPVNEQQSAQDLAARVLRLEHVLYPRVVQWLAQGQVQLDQSAQVQVHGVSQRHFWGGS
jgi:phosphoribosylglycinamide formyltransferase-1